VGAICADLDEGGWAEELSDPDANICRIMLKRRRPKQLKMELRTWGGRRAGSGRKPKGRKAGVPHTKRPVVSRHHPVHVTLRVDRAYRNLRTKQRCAVLKRAFAGAQREGFRITDWSIQRDHIHLIAEATNASLLSRGIQSFSIRAAKGLNALCGRRGVVFPDRYHVHVLKTPREVRSALCYVLNNARHHGLVLSTVSPDVFSSGVWFDGWRDGRSRAGPGEPRPVESPRSWLPSTGWRKHELIGVAEIPGCQPTGR